MEGLTKADLVSSVRRNHVQSRDVQPELARLCELACSQPNLKDQQTESFLVLGRDSIFPLLRT